jgi:hypothetical protein
VLHQLFDRSKAVICDVIANQKISSGITDVIDYLRPLNFEDGEKTLMTNSSKG